MLVSEVWSEVLHILFFSVLVDPLKQGIRTKLSECIGDSSQWPCSHAKGHD